MKQIVIKDLKDLPNHIQGLKLGIKCIEGDFQFIDKIADDLYRYTFDFDVCHIDTIVKLLGYNLQVVVEDGTGDCYYYRQTLNYDLDMFDYLLKLVRILYPNEIDNIVFIARKIKGRNLPDRKMFIVLDEGFIAVGDDGLKYDLVSDENGLKGKKAIYKIDGYDDYYCR